MYEVILSFFTAENMKYLFRSYGKIEHKETPVYRLRSLYDIIWIETKHRLFGYRKEIVRLLPTDVSLWPRNKLT